MLVALFCSFGHGQGSGDNSHFVLDVDDHVHLVFVSVLTCWRKVV